MTSAGARDPDEIDALARRAQAGAADALEVLLGAIRPRALSACRSVLPHLPDAEDACQEALLNVSRKIGSWHGRGRFTTWLHAVCVNSARSTYRRLKNQAVPADPTELTAAGPLERPDPRTTSVIAGTRLDLLEAMAVIERAHPQLVQPLLLDQEQWRATLERVGQTPHHALGLIYIGELNGSAGVDDAPGLGQRVSVYSRDGQRVALFGAADEGEGPGEFIAPHGIAVDSRGDIYVGEVANTIRGRQLDPPRELKTLKKLRRTT